MLDGAAVEATRAARARAFDALVSRHLEASYRLAAVIMGDRTEAEDATHDAFLSAWRNFSSLRDQNRFDAWFGRILVNTCRTRLRRSRRRVLDVSAELGLAGMAGKGDLAGEAADRDALGRAFVGLNLDQRIVVVLRYYADLSIDQIAERVGIPGGTVKSRLHAALRTLGVTLDESRIEDPR